MVKCLVRKEIAEGLAIIAAAVDSGSDPRQLAREIVEYLRGIMLIQVGSGNALTLTADALAEMKERAGQFSREQLLQAIRLFNQAAFELRASANPTLPLEIALVEATLEKTTSAPATVSPPSTYTHAPIRPPEPVRPAAEKRVVPPKRIPLK